MEPEAPKGRWSESRAAPPNPLPHISAWWLACTAALYEQLTCSFHSPYPLCISSPIFNVI